MTGQISVVWGRDCWQVVAHIGVLREVDGCGVR
jgi:hypothetical protein